MSGGQPQDFDFSKCDFDFAKVLEDAERFEDMVKVVTAASQKGTDILLPANRNLLSVAFKNVVGLRRSAWRVYNAKARDDKDKVDPQIIQPMIETVKNEIYKCCDQVIDLIDNTIMEKIKGLDDDDGSKKEHEVFFHKMTGDYYRYKCEVANEEDRKGFEKSAEEAYEKAREASGGLAATHPIQLGLILNYSVFLFEIVGDPTKACKLAKKGFDTAISELDEQEPNHKDSSLIMQLLRDNLTLWTSDNQDIDEEEN